MLNCRSLVWLKSDDAEGGSDNTDVGLDEFGQDRCRGRPVLVWLKVEAWKREVRIVGYGRWGNVRYKKDGNGYG